MPDKSISDAFLYGRIEKGNKVIKYLNSAKHPILLASDFLGSPSFANQLGLTTFQEMKAMVNARLSLENVLAAATIKMLSNSNGTIEAGKIANLLLLLKNNPLDSVDS